ncbi:YceI family protein [Pseudobacteriovorax antillogorgiicola]|uniref:Polyisoprenoid-binding protein YceI n=1 Tax=Pseudobacteriovorax antillogorgiicola TaxID=1513793 RepID=A0A1Y6BQ35_9BACT|nr:YceI family protein [Pseudobacteriovorax antillogorgiicola]TCS53764.1 polyisoprenoid-binding protein YceI [Pseudobacteriovorax antillogorgiicola]SMF22502.1 Polyisoprenoid-binding protein YceI [Pseudobacteriovorax antillogorgiicola]
MVIAILGTIVWLFASWAGAVTVNFDESKSELIWIARKVSGAHRGQVRLKQGQLSFNKGNVSGSFVIDMNSIENLDLKGSWKTKLESHLKSEDFFHVSAYPEATFRLTSAKAVGPREYIFSGPLTIRGVTGRISFPAVWKQLGGRWALKSQIRINRLHWGITYHSAHFFDIKAIGDQMIDDHIEFELLLVADGKIRALQPEQNSQGNRDVASQGPLSEDDLR